MVLHTKTDDKTAAFVKVAVMMMIMMIMMMMCRWLLEDEELDELLDGGRLSFKAALEAQEAHPLDWDFIKDCLNLEVR
jgi:hypothetical protein